MTTLLEAIDSLKKRHIEYIESTYHVRHPQIIKERRAILEQDGGVVSEPWIEGTPAYKSGSRITELNIPGQIRDLLQKLHDKDLGVFDPLYMHQTAALETFFHTDNPRDLVVATGTGSGKTEIFLYSILGNLALEGVRNKTTAKRAFRAIILYPMNALVSDQLARLRTTIGDLASSSIIKSAFGRIVQFGMYTSRTPYPGGIDFAKNERNVKPLVKYFVEMKRDPKRRQLFEGLRHKGRVPQKDLDGFLGENQSSRGNRFKTQLDDRELFTRQEMHTPNEFGGTPDILVTNYSMLEYMLLRPIEQPLFDSTREWLAADPSNQLLLVIDEAHLYRGAQGAEVSLLIRRLINHLKITRDRVRCILTSASLGNETTASAAGKTFASKLTGGDESQFEVIIGHRIRLGGNPPLPNDLGKVLQSVESDLNPNSLEELAGYFNWNLPIPTDEAERRLFLGTHLGNTEEFKIFHDALSETPLPLSKAGKTLFPDLSSEESNSAVLNLALLATTSFKDKDVPLYPVRIHRMFRGLPKLYACINKNCNGRLSKSEDSILGHLYMNPRDTCAYCGSRVFELMGHRTCGAIYLSAYFHRRVPDFPKFLWSNMEEGNNLQEVHLLLEEPRGDADYDPEGDVDHHTPLNKRIRAMYLDIKTGYILKEVPSDEDGFLKCWWPPQNSSGPKRVSKKRKTSESEEDDENEPLTWKRCYVCGINELHKHETLIMDHETRGEEPFANIIKSMFLAQAPSREYTLEEAKLFPNRGKKILCFSDGRQKAARLARDLQRTIEQDSFRELLMLAAQQSGEDATIDMLYPWVVYISSSIPLTLFDDGDGLEGGDYAGSRQRFLSAQEAVPELLEDYEATNAMDLFKKRNVRDQINSLKPYQYDQALLKALGDSNFSVRQTMVGYVEPTKSVLEFIQRSNSPTDPELVRGIVMAVINWALEVRILDPDIRKDDRQLSRKSLRRPQGYPGDYDDGLRLSELLPEDLRFALEELGETAVKKMALSLRDEDYENRTEPLFTAKKGGFWLNPKAISLRVDAKEGWKRCDGCGRFSPYDFSGRCPDFKCRGKMVEVQESDLYLAARKDFFRNPVQQALGLRTPIRPPFMIRSEEHSAQLSYRDSTEVFGRTERNELLFQDVLLDDREERPQPIDVLSCTTTMEVGIDIGSLTGVALRTVPPRPDNYQQRAGRAGRRGTALSMITTFADNSPQEMYMFDNPSKIIGVESAAPDIYIENLRILERHISATLIQEFFQRKTELSSAVIDNWRSVFESLGTTKDFFADEGGYCLSAFESWVNREILDNASGLIDAISLIIPEEVANSNPEDNAEGWRQSLIASTAGNLVQKLKNLKNKGDWVRPDDEKSNLLSDLMKAGLLPTFGFPLDLCEFTVLDYDRTKRRDLHSRRGPPPIVHRYSMTEGLSQALSEYVPGREVVVDKHTFVSYGLYFPFSRDHISRGRSENWEGLEWLNYCDVCNTVLEDRDTNLEDSHGECQLNHKIKSVPRYRPLGFAPEVVQNDGAKEDRTRVSDRGVFSRAELPTPIGVVHQEGDVLRDVSQNAQVRSMPNKQLVIRNYGPHRKGYTVCTECGAISLKGELPTYHNRPYQIENWRITSSKMIQCGGHSKTVAFAHDFRTDLAILSVSARSPIKFAPLESWFSAAARSLSEALVLGATRVLGIDSSELSGNWRFVGRYHEDGMDVRGRFEFFLYDTTPGGAGFADEAGHRFNDVLKETRNILQGCDCDSSCHKCIRTYNNRFFHNTLTRLGALALLTYAETGEILQLASKKVSSILDRVSRVVKLIVKPFFPDALVDSSSSEYLIVSANQKKTRIVVDPVFLDRVQELIPQSRLSGGDIENIQTVRITDYEAEHSMPNIVERILAALGD